MKNDKLTSQLRSQLESLSYRRSIQFGLDICKRLYPDYVNFFQKYAWGSPERLNKALKLCEKSLSTSEIDEDEFINHMEQVEAVTPDTEDFGDWEGSYALNAATAVLDLLNFCINHEITYLLNIGSYMTDTIDFKLSEENASLTDEQLKEHPRIITELLHQIEQTK